MHCHVGRSRQHRATVRQARIVLILLVAMVGIVRAQGQPREDPGTPDVRSGGGSTRELSADRPDRTDCPFTVEPGHYQIEMDIVNFTFDAPGAGDTRTRVFQIMPLNVKFGLLRNVDLQLVVMPWTRVRTTGAGPGPDAIMEGFGDIIPRIKVNLAGNDIGFFALALLPFVKLPTGSGPPGNSSIESGVGVPFSFDVPDWDVGFQTTYLIARNGGDDGYHSEITNSVSVGHGVVGPLSIAAEFFASVSTETGSLWEGTTDCWLTYQVNSNLRLDAGVYIGVTEVTDDLHPWLGFTWRW